MRILIHKHTPVRRPVSRHITLIMENTYNVPFDLKPKETLLLVQDISIGLENPLDITNTQPLNVWNEWGEWTPEMVKTIDNIKLPKNSDITFFSTPRPSPLTRVKERFKR